MCMQCSVCMQLKKQTIRPPCHQAESKQWLSSIDNQAGGQLSLVLAEAMGATRRSGALVLAIIVSALLFHALVSSSHARDAPRAPAAATGSDVPPASRGLAAAARGDNPNLAHVDGGGYPDPPGGRLDPPHCCG